MDQRAKLEDLKRQADECARKFAELVPLMRNIGEVEIYVSYEDLAARIAAKAPATNRISFLGAVRV